ncbi:MAG: (5-formylfuran-3-yl)methyl phosphate synthase [Gammaproteobacteria bacterium]
MTGFLASVASVQEAGVVLAAGADVVDLKAAGRGVLGALPVAVVREAVGFVAGRRTVSAATGDLPPDPAIVRHAVRVVRAAGVDIVKVGFFGPARRREVVRALGEEARAGTMIVAVLFADREVDLTRDLAEIARQGLQGVMLDTCDKAGRGLRDHWRDEALGRFVEVARGLGLQTGLAGSLRAADIGPLLTLAPDYLGFRGALCGDRGREGAIDTGAVLDIRTRIPVHGSTMPAGRYNVVEAYHELAG